MFKEFKEFAMKGNLVDMAVGFILGGAFGTVVKSLVADIVMPPVGLLLGGVDFSEIKTVLKPAEIGADGVAVAGSEVAMNWGLFLNNGISFIIVALCMFFIIKGINSLKKKEEAAPAAPPAQEVLLTEIRDLLSKK